MRLNALDGWRGIACLMVAVFHFSANHSLYFQGWLRNCAPLLEFFFIVSGFVMAFAFADSVKSARGYAGYMIRRLGRVWPLHLFTLGLLLLMACAKALLGAENGGFYESMSANAIVPQIFMLQTWMGMGLTWNFPAWTLSAEFAAYIVFGLLVWLLPGPRGRALAALGLIAGGTYIFFVELLQQRDDYNVVSVARCFTGFFLGFLLYHLWKWRQIQSLAVLNVLEVLIAIGFVISIQAHFTGAAYFLNFIVFGGLVYVFAHDRGFVSRAVSIKPLLWLGKVSFSLYMIHAVIKIYIEDGFHLLERVTGQQFFFRYANPFADHPAELMSLGPIWANDLMLLGYVAIVIVSAALVYRYIEDPTRSYSAKLAKRLQAAAPAKMQGAAGAPQAPAG